ncbi:MAG: amino acid permease [Gemmatimonadetes bacterium]|nr:amino acid permease [Gemmatimonadota bacterium]
MTQPAAPELRRSIGLVQASAMVVGTILGASIFVQPSVVTGHVPSISGVFLVWAVAGVLTLFGSLVSAELASAYPQTGGVYVFLRTAFSPALGFLWGWAMFWSMHSGIVAALGMVFARYAAFFWPLGDFGIKAVAVAAILALSAINYLGVKEGSALQTAFTIGKLLAVGGIIVVGFALGSRLPEHFVPSAEPGEAQYSPALIAGLFTFGGWHMVTYAAGETRDPQRTIPQALVFGTLIVTVCYVALNAVYLYVLPLDDVARSTRIAADAADALLGAGGGAFMAALVMFSTFGGLSGIVLAGPRVYFSMAQDRLLFGWLRAVHPRFRTPARAIALQGVWSSVLVVTGTYQELLTRVVYTEWIFFALMAAGLFALRRRPDYQPRYRVFGFPIVPAAFIVSSLGIVINQIRSDPVESIGGLALVLIGWPVYHVWVRRPPPGNARASH